MNVVYIITGDSFSISLVSLCISAASLKLTNPSAHITLVSDFDSERIISGLDDCFKAYFDRIMIIGPPKGSPTFRNRYIKIRLREIIKGDILYLDNDTLIRGPIDGIFRIDSDVALAKNHSLDSPRDQVWQPEREVIERLGWKLIRSDYFNGGVIFFKDSAATREFSNIWHERWREGIRVAHWERDQAALNAALSQSALKFHCLPHEFNYQFRLAPRSVRNAVIWHYYSSIDLKKPDTRFYQVVNKALLSRRFNLSDVVSLLSSKHPWLRGGFLGDVFQFSLERGFLLGFSVAILRERTASWAIRKFKNAKP